jgi:chromate reductase
MAHTVAVIIGSLRKAAFSRKMADALIGLAPASLAMQIVPIGDLPLYNEELEADVPPAWAAFRAAVRPVAGVLFVTPEYNRSVPGGLKNAIDVGSRPYGQSVWSKKPAGVVSVSPGAVSGFGANHHLRQSLVFLDMPTLQQPEAYIGQAHKLFDAEGHLANDDTRKFLDGFMQAFAAWVAAHAPA